MITMTIKVDSNKTDVLIGINNNSKEPGDTNNILVHNDQHATAPEQIQISPVIPNDHSTLYTRTYRYSTSNSNP